MSAEEKAAKAAAKKSAAQTKARERAQAGMPHAMTAAERSRAGLPREARPGDELRVQARGAGYRPDPFAKLSATTLQHLYGDHQLGAALSVYSLDKLRSQPLAEVMAAHPGTKPTNMNSRASVVSYITRMQTGGKYSADFGERAPRSRGASSRGVDTRSRPAASPTPGSRPTTKASTKASTATPHLTPLPGAEHIRVDPLAPLNTRTLIQLYGERQLRDALGVYSASKLRDVAQREGVTRPGRTVAELADRITAHATDGRYGKAAPSASARTRARAKKTSS